MKGKMRHTVIYTIVASLTLSGCHSLKSLRSDYQRPADIQTTRLAGHVNEADYEALPQWRQMFADPLLQQLIDSTLANNTDLLNADLKIQEAEEALHTAKLAFFPSVAFNPSGTISSFDFAKPTKAYSIPVAASWQVDIFGSLRNAKKRSEVVVELNKTSRQAIQTALVANVASMYYTLEMLDREYGIAQETADNWKETVRVIKALKEAGRATQASVAQMEGTYQSVLTQLEDLSESRVEIENALCALMGETPHAISRGKLDSWNAPVDFLQGIPVSLLGQRPDVRIAEQNLAAAFYTVNQSRAAFYPSLNLSGQAGWTNNAGMIINPGKMLLTAVASLTQPIFANGQISAQYHIALAQQEEAKNSFQQTLINAGSEVNTYLAQLQNANKKRTLFDSQVKSYQEAVRSTDLLMRHGTTTYLEVLTAKQALLQAQLAQVANYNDEIQAVVNLYQALGGGN